MSPTTLVRYFASFGWTLERCPPQEQETPDDRWRLNFAVDGNPESMAFESLEVVDEFWRAHAACAQAAFDARAMIMDVWRAPSKRADAEAWAMGEPGYDIVDAFVTGTAKLDVSGGAHPWRWRSRMAELVDPRDFPVDGSRNPFMGETHFRALCRNAMAKEASQTLGKAIPMPVADAIEGDRPARRL